MLQSFARKRIAFKLGTIIWYLISYDYVIEFNTRWTVVFNYNLELKKVTFDSERLQKQKPSRAIDDGK